MSCLNALALLAAVGGCAAGANADLIYGLTTNGALVSFNSNDPSNVSEQTPITGLQPDETLVAMDFRPASGGLYALGSSSRLYQLDTATGLATTVGAGPFSTPLSGTHFGFDFNPVADLIRVTSDTGQNLRLDPATGEIVGVDSPLAYAAGDVNEGRTPNVVAAAYSNNVAGASSTTLYVLDSTLEVLATQAPPNGGVLHTVGSFDLMTDHMVGLDISPSGTAWAIFDPPTSITWLYRINLETGEAFDQQIVQSTRLLDVAAAVPAPATGMLFGVVLVARRRRPSA